MKAIATKYLAITIQDFEFELTLQEAFKVGLYLTGHNWGNEPGDVRYLGSLARPVIITHALNAFPDITVEQLMLNCVGRDSDELTLIIAPGVSYKTSRKELSVFINGFLDINGIPPIPFPATPDQCVDNSSDLDKVSIPVNEPGDNHLKLAIGFYINYVGAKGATMYPGIFTTNKSVSRPSSVRLIVLGER